MNLLSKGGASLILEIIFVSKIAMLGFGKEFASERVHIREYRVAKLVEQ